MPAPTPANEAERLAALQRYHILDTAPEQAYDDFARLAAAICQTPMATMTFVDGDRQWFKARIGLDKVETPREDAICAHTIMGDHVLIVEDARRDARFATFPCVTSDPRVRFYAGAPLIDSAGLALGSVCVLDREPRHLTRQQTEALEALARRIIHLLEFRRTCAQLAAALAELNTLRGLLPMCAHCKDVRDAAGSWQSFEEYLSAHHNADVTHGICPGCLREQYPEVYADLQARGKI